MDANVIYNNEIKYSIKFIVIQEMDQFQLKEFAVEYG